MLLTVHREIPKDESLKRQWNELVQQMQPREIFYTYEWAAAVAGAYVKDLVPLLLLAYESDSLVGLVALATNQSGETVFLASTTADYCDFICHPSRRVEFLNAVFARLRALNAGVVRLANLPADSTTAGEIKRTARRHEYSTFSRPAYSCAQVAIDSPEAREAVSESAQRRMRRYAKTLGKKTPVTFSHAKSINDIGAELPGFARAHVARFLATGRISNLAHPQRRLFLQDLASSLSEAGSVTLSRMMAGDQVVAWNYGFRFAGSWFWYQPTFATGFQKYSPGLWLLSKIVEESCQDADLSRIDLGLGAEGYKDRLATASRQTLHVTVTASAVGCWKERARYYSATAIRSIPRLERWVRAGIRRADSLKTRFKSDGISGSFKRLARRGQKILRDQSEFFFLEWPGEPSQGARQSPSQLAILPIDLDLLATATMHYVEDPETLEYLLRAAERLSLNRSQGFALVTREGLPLHFCWVTDFEKFSQAELKHTVKSPSSNAALIVDCWTPTAVRGQGNCREAIACVASQLQAAGKPPWICISADDAAAVRGAEAAGFVGRFSLRYERFMLTRHVIESQLTTTGSHPDVEVSSAA